MLSGKNAIITGASLGLGKEIARQFVSTGANVLICARDLSALERTAAELMKNKVREEQIVKYCSADISDKTEIDHLIGTARDIFGEIDILVNNAAIQGPIGPMEENPWDFWKKTIQTDLLGPAYLIHSVLPMMKARKKGKIINLSGGGATGPRENYSAYATAKTGIVRLTETLARETEEYGIDINAIAPGAMNGRMLEETLAAGEEAVGAKEYAKAVERRQKGGTSPEIAAKLCVFLASGESDGITGRLISAVWDDWEHFSEERKEKLQKSDIYTLRRIIPQDRGENWDK